MRTFEEIIKEAHSQRLTLNNLFELDDAGHVWQANFRHATGFHDFGRGPTPSDALEDALARCKGLKGPENRPIPKAPPKPKEEGLDALL